MTNEPMTFEEWWDADSRLPSLDRTYIAAKFAWNARQPEIDALKLQVENAPWKASYISMRAERDSARLRLAGAFKACAEYADSCWSDVAARGTCSYIHDGILALTTADAQKSWDVAELKAQSLLIDRINIGMYGGIVPRAVSEHLKIAQDMIRIQLAERMAKP